MAPFDALDIPSDLKKQWTKQTGFKLDRLRSLCQHNSIHVPILNQRFFCQLMIAEAISAKDADELTKRAVQVMKSQLDEQYSLMDHIYRDSYESNKSLAQDTSTSLRSACRSGSIQDFVEVFCKVTYTGEGTDELPDNTYNADSNSDDDDLPPETQYLPTDDDCAGIYVSEGEDRVKELGDVSAPGSPSSGDLHGPLAASQTLLTKAPFDASRTSIAEPSDVHNDDTTHLESLQKGAEGDSSQEVSILSTEQSSEPQTPEMPTDAIESCQQSLQGKRKRSFHDDGNDGNNDNDSPKRNCDGLNKKIYDGVFGPAGNCSRNQTV